MENNEIKSVLMKASSFQEIQISGDGRHFQIIAVSEMFNGMSRIEKQKTIYSLLSEYISNGQIHAVSIKTYTPKEWKLDCKINKS